LREEARALPAGPGVDLHDVHQSLCRLQGCFVAVAPLELPQPNLGVIRETEQQILLALLASLVHLIAEGHELVVDWKLFEEIAAGDLRLDPVRLSGDL
jgi:hypothetical protein